MLKENTVFAQRIIDFYAAKGVDCSIVDEHMSLLVTLTLNGVTHEFRYGKRAFAGIRHAREFYMTLEREFCRLRRLGMRAGLN